MVDAENVDLMRAGMDKNVFVLQIIIELMEYVEHAILIQVIMEGIAFAIMDSMEMLINVINVILHVVNVKVQVKANA